MSGITFESATPGTDLGRWFNLISMLAGVLVGWIVSPITWIVAGPFRMMAMMGAQAAQESTYHSTVCGDKGASCGILQFKLSTIESLGGSNADRSSPFWSGYYGVRYVRAGLLYDSHWFLIAVPVYGYAVLRYMWTHGWGAASPWGVAWSKKGIGGSMTTDEGVVYSEPRAWGAFIIWRTLTLLPMFCLARSYRMKQGGKSKSRKSA